MIWFQQINVPYLILLDPFQFVTYLSHLIFFFITHLGLFLFTDFFKFWTQLILFVSEVLVSQGHPCFSWFELYFPSALCAFTIVYLFLQDLLLRSYSQFVTNFFYRISFICGRLLTYSGIF